MNQLYKVIFHWATNLSVNMYVKADTPCPCGNFSDIIVLRVV
jgi:hypothetical protein